MSSDAASDETGEDAIRRVLDGDVEAFATVIDRHESAVRSYLASRCPPDIEEAEIAHRVFIAAFQDLGSYRADAGVRAWLIGIARHRLLAECRRVRTAAEHARRHHVAIIAEAQARLLDHESAADERMAALASCMERLDAVDRRLIDLRYRADASIIDIAASVGRSDGAIKKHLFLIRRRLQECMTRAVAQAASP